MRRTLGSEGIFHPDDLRIIPQTITSTKGPSAASQRLCSHARRRPRPAYVLVLLSLRPTRFDAFLRRCRPRPHPSTLQQRPVSALKPARVTDFDRAACCSQSRAAAAACTTNIPMRGIADSPSRSSSTVACATIHECVNRLSKTSFKDSGGQLLQDLSASRPMRPGRAVARASHMRLIVLVSDRFVASDKRSPPAVADVVAFTLECESARADRSSGHPSPSESYQAVAAGSFNMSSSIHGRP